MVDDYGGDDDDDEAAAAAGCGSAGRVITRAAAVTVWWRPTGVTETDDTERESALRVATRGTAFGLPVVADRARDVRAMRP